MRMRSVEELLNGGEELDEGELFQLDEAQYELYEMTRRRAEWDVE